MLGYLAGPRVGAWTYNLFHHRGLAALILMGGWLWEDPYLTLAGIILFGHTSMDRMFGYGLKFEDAFEHTHLGFIGRSASAKASSEEGVRRSHLR